MKNFYRGMLMALAFLGLTNQVPAQNLLADGSFSTTTALTPYTYNYPFNQWCSWSVDPSSATTSIIDGVCKFSIVTPGNASWEIQMMQWGFQVEKGAKYRLTFDVKSSVDRNFGVYIGEESGSWTAFNWDIYQQQATTSWQTKQLEFSVWNLYSLYKLSFEMGGQMGDMYFDNISLEKIGAADPIRIEMLGSAVPPYDWSTGVELATTDGIHYSISNYILPNGELKFRVLNNWGTNWGSVDFPIGTGYAGGPNIPVRQGTYDISFNRETGEYRFYCPGCPPAIGIIGSAVIPYYNWTNDKFMSTTDGIIYMLNKCDLGLGELRFRQDANWANNWGGPSFPEGVGTIESPNIQVMPGNYNISFNRITGAYQFQLNIPVISIIGTGIADWATEVDMQSTDGINYLLENQTLKNGEVKFRQDHQWYINWGASSFPWGAGYSNGPNIPVTEGKYNIMFNRMYGNYNFQLICPALTLTCPGDIEKLNDAGACGAVITYNTPVVTDQCGNPLVYQIDGLPSGALFPVGTTTNTFLALNDAGSFTWCSFKVTVIDKERPVITGVSLTPKTLWPANHNMIDVNLDYSITDNCGVMSTELKVSSNEPVNGINEGDKSPDWMIIDNHHIQLRAERAGNGKGRTYTISITATDLWGNVSVRSAEVFVPHDAADFSLKGAEKVGDISEAANALQVTVTPNPSNGYFNLKLKSASNEMVSVSVMDASGRLVSTATTAGNQTFRIGNGLEPGIYIVQLKQGKLQKTVRLVKQ